MAFKTGLLGGSKSGWIMGVVVNVVVARGTGVLQFLDVEPMGNGNIVGVYLRRGTFDIQNPRMATNAVWVNLVKLGRKTGMVSAAL